MKSSPSVLQKILRKLRRPKSDRATRQPLPRSRRVLSSLEPLEGRISPAALINPSTLMYKDLDGDIVTVTFSKALFNKTDKQVDLAEANQVFQFTGGNGVDSTTFNAATALPQQLLLVDLTKAPSTATANLASGASLTISAVKGSLVVGGQSTPGDGAVNVGYIKAQGIALGTVSIAGDLGRIDAGTASSLTGLAGLKVHSIGVANKSVTQQAAGASLQSNITGALGLLSVTGDINGADLEVQNGQIVLNGQIKTSSFGNIGSIVIGGSLKGVSTVASSSDHTGLINAAGNIGTVTIGKTATDGIVGGGGKNSGSVRAGGKIAGVTLSGDVLGGGGDGSGSIVGVGAVGPVLIKGNLTGAGGTNSGILQTGALTSVTIGHHLNGGTAANTGTITSSASIGTVKIGTVVTDGIAGNSGQNSGSVHAATKIGTVMILGDVAGGATAGSGAITAGTSIGPVTISHDLKGGGGTGSGVVQAGTLGAVTITHSLIGGTANNSGLVSSDGAMGAVIIGGDLDGNAQAGAATGVGGISAGGAITSVTVGGALKGGASANDGFISAGTTLGAVKLHDLTGGAGQFAGSVSAQGAIASVTVTGNLSGAGGVGSASISSGLDSQLVGDLGAIKIGGQLQGGSVDYSGTISSGGKIASVAIGSAAPGAPGLLKGGAGNYSGAILSQGAIGAVTITGSVEGGSGSFSGAIVSHDRVTESSEAAGDLGAVIVTGHLAGGTGPDSGEIYADGNLTSATTGDLTGNTGPHSGSIRAGQGVVHSGVTGAITVKGAFTGAITSEGHIASVTVTGDTTGGSVRSGNDIGTLTFKNVDQAQISARGQAVQGATTDLAIGKINVSGHVANSQFLAGYNTAGQAENADAQIGAVNVLGDWTASNLVAGVIANNAAGFGTSSETVINGHNSPKIISQIASIVIGGNVTGTAAAGDEFGFTAEKIGSFKSKSGTEPFNTLADGQSFDVASDVAAREVPVV